MSAHEGRRVVITGAAAGIGRAIPSAFLGEGARVHVCDRDARALEDFLRAAEGDLGPLVRERDDDCQQQGAAA